MNIIRKLLGKPKSDIWHLKKVSMIDYMLCVMEDKEFDGIVEDNRFTVPVIDGVAYVYLSTPAYPIIVMRKSKVSSSYGK
jgi:hypothetical protein